MSLPAGLRMHQVTGSLVQPDGKTVVVGSGRTGEGGMLAARLNADGSPDTSFGNAGVLRIEIPSTIYARAFGVVRQPDGKIVVVGGSQGRGGQHVVVARLDTSGRLDPTFDGDGLALFTSNVPGVVAGFDAVLQPDGRIVVSAGSDPYNVFPPSLPPREQAIGLEVLRITPSGSLDTSFDGDGRATVSFDVGTNVTGRSVALQPDGKIVVAGDFLHGSNTRMGVARFNANGSVDTTFGGNGTRTVEFSGLPSAHSVLVQPDGKIILSGATRLSLLNGTYHLVAARFNADGNLDSSFAGNGLVQFLVEGVDFAVANRLVSDAALYQGDRLMLVGTTASRVSNSTNDILLVRLGPDGLPDPSFSASGTRALSFGEFDLGSSIVAHPDGQVTVVGISSTNGAGNSDDAIVVARYLSGQATQPGTPPGSGGSPGLSPIGPQPPANPNLPIIPRPPIAPSPVTPRPVRVGPRVVEVSTEQIGRRRFLAIRFDSPMYTLPPNGTPLFELRAAGRDGQLFTRHDRVRRIPMAQLVGPDRSVALIPIGPQGLPRGPLMLTVFSQRFRNRDGNRLDGNGDGQAGGDFVYSFS